MIEKSKLENEVDRFVGMPQDELMRNRDHALNAVHQLRMELNRGVVRAAEPTSGTASGWKVNSWVKRGILLGFKLGKLEEVSTHAPWQFFDRSTIPMRQLTLQDNVRLVPGGTAVRDGAYLAPSVIIMPPAYVNIGSYVGAGTMIDSHALVGSCAQIGERVHVSAASQIGGVLEPAGAMPVIIEDDVLLGGNTGVYEGCIVKKRAVLASGVVLTGSTPIYDLVNSRVITRPSSEEPLVVPEGAVVVAGSRAIGGKSEFATANGLSLYAPIIIKYRDERTDARTALEGALRQ